MGPSTVRTSPVPPLDRPRQSFRCLQDWRFLKRRPFKRAFLPYDPDAVEAAGGVERVSARRKALGISIENPAGEDTTAPPLQKLTELPLPNWLAEAIRWEQLDEAATASAIQAQLLPIVLAGENAILVSEAKSGAEAFVYLMLASLQVSDQDPLTEEEFFALGQGRLGDWPDVEETEMKRIFTDADMDGNGFITFEEFCIQLENPWVQAFLSGLDIDITDARIVFTLLDVDGSGGLTVEEFVDGALKLKGPAKGIDMLSMMFDLVRYNIRFSDFCSFLEDQTNQIKEFVRPELVTSSSAPRFKTAQEELEGLSHITNRKVQEVTLPNLDPVEGFVLDSNVARRATASAHGKRLFVSGVANGVMKTDLQREFDSAEDASDALREVTGRKLKGMVLKVKMADVQKMSKDGKVVEKIGEARVALCRMVWGLLFSSCGVFVR
eukprot:g24738.t1